MLQSPPLTITESEKTLIQSLKSKLFDPATENYPVPLGSSSVATTIPNMKEFGSLLSKHLERSEVDDDLFYIRWLRSTNGDVSKSFDMIIELIKWRVRLNLDNLTPSRFEDILNKVDFIYFMGSDNEGCPVICLDIEKFVPGTIQPYETVEEMVGFVLEIALHELLLKSEGKLERFVVVIDYYGWGLSSVDTKLDKAILGTCQGYFPERLKAACLLRAPWLFSTAWAVAKVFLDEKTTEKIMFVYESDMNSELKKRIASETLLQKYGGQSNKTFTFKQYLAELVGPTETLADYYNKKPIAHLRKQQ